MQRLGIAPEVTLVFQYRRRPQLRAPGIKEALGENGEGVLGLLFGNRLLSGRVFAEAYAGLQVASILAGRGERHRAGIAELDAALNVAEAIAIDPSPTATFA